MRKRLLLPALMAAFFASALPVQAADPSVTVGESHLAAIDGAAARLGRRTDIPTILSASDAEIYRSIIDAQAQGRWAVADRLMARLQDPLLVGDLLASRYLSAGYRSDLNELETWLSRYEDLTPASDIYDLAKRRFGSAVTAQRPGLRSASSPSYGRGGEEDATWESFSIEPNRNLSSADSRRMLSLKDQFRTYVHKGDFDQAVALLDSPRLRDLFQDVDYDELKSVLAIGLFGAGRDVEALRWADEAAARSGDILPESHWVAGLALWRNGSHALSARHFEAVANSADASPWLVSAGAYWAARANLAGRHPDLVNHWLLLAATNPRSFYGLLARRALGQDIFYSWEARPFTDLDAQALLRVPAARRALALMQLGENDRAEDELSGIAATAAPSLAQSLLALAHTRNLPGVTMRLGNSMAEMDGRLHDAAAYPMPEWHPLGGWTVDKALILAIVRQESGFNPHARSPAGATGLMQLMPRTARSLGHRGKLSNPEVNLEVGQRFVRSLLDDDSIHGNLLFLAASYNSGQGNVARWMQTVHHEGDPLLFMESIPTPETRAFVARVMTNYWAYRNRLGLDSPSLDAMAAGDWPMYDDGRSNALAVKNVKD